MRKLLLLLLLAVAAFGQATLTIFPLNDITIAATRAALATTGIARWCQLTALSTNTGGVRWGDSTVTASRGANIAPGGAQFIPPTYGQAPGNGSAPFSLSSVYVIGTANDKLTVTCAR